MEKMKVMQKVTTVVNLVCVVVISTVSVLFVSSVREIQSNLDSVYILQSVQARQIETLFNMEIRRSSPEVQAKLDALATSSKKYHDDKDIADSLKDPSLVSKEIEDLTEKDIREILK